MNEAPSAAQASAHRARVFAEAGRRATGPVGAPSQVDTPTPADGLSLYQFVRAAVYHGVDPEAVVEHRLVLGSLPPGLGVGVAAGAPAVRALVAGMEFDERIVRWLRRQPGVRAAEPAFGAALAALRFSGHLELTAPGTRLAPGATLALLRCRAWVAPLLIERMCGLLALYTGAASWTRACSQALGGVPVVGTGPAGWLPAEATIAATAGAIVGGLRGTVHVEAGTRATLPVWSARTLDTLNGTENNLTVDLPDESRTEAAVDALAPHRSRISAVRVRELRDAPSLLRLRRALDREDMRMVRILLDVDAAPAGLAALHDQGAPVDLVGVRTHRLLMALSPGAVVPVAPAHTLPGDPGAAGQDAGAGS